MNTTASKAGLSVSYRKQRHKTSPQNQKKRFTQTRPKKRKPVAYRWTHTSQKSQWRQSQIEPHPDTQTTMKGIKEENNGGANKHQAAERTFSRRTDTSNKRKKSAKLPLSGGEAWPLRKHSGGAGFALLRTRFATSSQEPHHRLSQTVGGKRTKIRTTGLSNTYSGATRPEDFSNIRVVALGAGQDVGRSCVLVSLNKYNILFDCGMHPGRTRPDQKFPQFDRLYQLTNTPRDRGLTEALDLVIVTHFHLDHIGALPILTELKGYHGPLYMTHPTKAIADKYIYTYYIRTHIHI